MTQPLDDDQLRGMAKRRLKARRAFWEYLVMWAGVSALCTGIWFTTSGVVSYFWPIWPILGIGIGAIATAWAAYGPVRRPITDDDIEREVSRIRGR
jgi:hypothetical protein